MPSDPELGAVQVDRNIFQDSDDNGGEVDQQLGRVRSTCRVEQNDKGVLSVTYVSERGEKSTVSARQDIKDRTAGEMPWAKKLRVATIALFACLGSMLFGLDIGYIGPLVESASFRHDVVHTDTGSMDSGVEGLIVSLFSVGAIVTSFPVVSSYFLDVWGRKYSIMVGTVVFILGSLVQGTATGTAQLLVGRFVAGMSIGLLSSVVVLYQSEMAPASMRGALSTLYQLGVTFGILVAAYIDELVVDRSEGWRFVMAIICIPAVLLLLGMSFMPRSPRWLVQVGRRKEALKVLLSIRSEEDAIQEELEIYQETETAKLEGEPAWSELLQGRIFRLVVLGVTLQLLQQLVGMNAFMYFGPKIFEAIGFDKNQFTTINNFVNFVSTFPAVFLADRAGRRSLMLWSSIGMSVACIVMGVIGLVYVEKDMPTALHSLLETARASNPAMAQQAAEAFSDSAFSEWPATLVSGLAAASNSTVAQVTKAAESEAAFKVVNSEAGWVIAISAFFFVFNFAYGFGPIVWVYCVEIFPLKYRARAVGICTMANWVGNTLIAQFTPMLLSSIQFSTFFVFGFFCVLSVFLSAWLPETKGVPLELIQQLFDAKAGFKGTTAGKQKGDGGDAASDSSSSSSE